MIAFSNASKTNWVKQRNVLSNQKPENTRMQNNAWKSKSIFKKTFLYLELLCFWCIGFLFCSLFRHNYRPHVINDWQQFSSFPCNNFYRKEDRLNKTFFVKDYFNITKYWKCFLCDVKSVAKIRFPPFFKEGISRNWKCSNYVNLATTFAKKKKDLNISIRLFATLTSV